jgi:tetratricopeptide (TPR) repeat protein
MLVLALLAMLAATAPDEGGLVEIRESAGSVDGPAEAGLGAPRWERLSLELRVANRLSAQVEDLEVEVALLRAGGQDVIPGWTFRRTLDDAVLPPRGEADLRLEHDLPPRRASPRADELAYRARLVGYRLATPDLATALTLLGSREASDQRAALRSYEGRPGAWAGAEAELAAALDAPADDPGPADALRLLFAMRALGTLGATAHIGRLLELPERLEREAWGRAVRELIARITAASDADAPRRLVLPSWAGSAPALVALRAADAVEEVAREAMVRMGDPAVPALVTAARRGRTPAARARAERALAAMGRSTLRAQLAVRDPAVREAVIEEVGRLGSTAPVAALALLLDAPDPATRGATERALSAIGPAALPALLDAIGPAPSPGLDAAVEALVSRAPAAARVLAREAGVAERGPPAALAKALVLARRTVRARGAAEALAEALAAGRAGSFDEALARARAILAAAPALTASAAERLAAVHRARAEHLLDRGDLDVAIEAADAAARTWPSPEADALAARARLELARGLIELGDLDRAAELLTEVPPGAAGAREAEQRLLEVRARGALEAGDLGRARRLVDRALAAGPPSASLAALERRVALSERSALVVVAAAGVALAVLGAAAALARRRKSLRLEQLARSLDEAPGGEGRSPPRAR